MNMMTIVMKMVIMVVVGKVTDNGINLPVIIGTEDQVVVGNQIITQIDDIYLEMEN